LYEEFHQHYIPSKQPSEVARDLRTYASGVTDGTIAAKLLAAAAELDAGHTAPLGLYDAS